MAWLQASVFPSVTDKDLVTSLCNKSHVELELNG
jgi:hypothetical protein